MLKKQLQLLALILTFSIVKLNGEIITTPFNPLDITDTQGGILEFKNEYVHRYSNTTQNLDTLILKNYSGLPLKAMQFKIKIENGSGVIKLKSVNRGSSLPPALYMFDYQVHKGLVDANGNTYDIVSVVFLGNGWNALAPANQYHIATLEYEIGEVNPNQETIVYAKLIDVVGATANPVLDALIKTDNFETIEITKYQQPINDEDKILKQNYPNPFNPSTKIKYTLTPDGIHQMFPVTLKVYDILGNEIVTLVDAEQPAGSYEVEFNIVKQNLTELASGIYIYQLRTNSIVESNKMLIIK